MLIHCKSHYFTFRVLSLTSVHPDPSAPTQRRFQETPCRHKAERLLSVDPDNLILFNQNIVVLAQRLHRLQCLFSRLCGEACDTTGA